MDLLPELEKAMAADDRGWRRVRSWPTGRRELASLALLLAVQVLIVVVTPRLDLAAYPTERLIAGIGVLVAGTAVAFRLFLQPSCERAPRVLRLGATAALMLLFPVAFALLPPPHAHVHLHPESFEGVGADFMPRAVACLVFGTLVAVPTMAFLLAANRRDGVSAVRVALAGAAGGLAGTLGLLLHCPLVSVSHRIAGHGAVGLVAAALCVAAAAFLARGNSAEAA
jgi:hypothetical protein